MSQQLENGDIQPDLSPSSQPNQDSVASSQQLLSEDKFFIGGRNYYYQPLYDAAQRGDWESAKNFIYGNPSALTAGIAIHARTVLHVAAIRCQWGFILKLLELPLSPGSIAVQDQHGNTVLHFVARGGDLKTAKRLVGMNPDLPRLANNQGYLPLSVSSTGGRKMLWYLISVTHVESSNFSYFTPSLPQILRNIIQSGHLDIALYLVKQYPSSALAIDEFGYSLLLYLVQQPSYFFSASNLGFFERCIYKFLDTEGYRALVTSPQQGSFVAQVFPQFKGLLWKAIVQLAPSIQEVQKAKSTHECAVELVHCVCAELSNLSFLQTFEFLQIKGQEILLSAAANGNEEIVEILLYHFPDLIYIDTKPKHNILETAIEYRQEKIVNIIKKTSVTIVSALESDSGNTILHLAGKLAPDFKLFSVSGAALQMQRELQWFKEVEKISYRLLKEHKNADNQRAKDVFRKEHKQLAEQGEKWMKDTANSCMLVATLIATVLFAAAFTGPGGDTEDIPFFLQTNAFMIFAISNALGLFSSLTSLLMFLAILTARYAIDDFLESLPKKLVIGLGTLFFAIAAMIIAFGAALTILLGKRWQWVSLPIIILSSFPVAIFVMLQLPLFIHIVQSTYGSGIFYSWPSSS